MRRAGIEHCRPMTDSAQTEPASDSALALASLVAGAIAMGVSPVFVRYSGIGPFSSAFWRVALALPFLFAWAAIEARGSSRRLSFVWSQPVVLAGLFFAGDLIFWHLAILNTTMANATLMACLAPVWVLMLSGLVIGEAVPARAFGGLAICLAGAGLLVGSSYGIDSSRIVGDLYGVATSLFFGLYFLAVRAARRSLPGGQMLFLSSIVTALVLLAVAVVSGDDFLPGTAAGLAALAALGLVSHAGGQGLLAFALGSLSAAFSSLVIFLEAVAAALFGWLVFGESMGPAELAGAALILGGVWIARPASDAGRR
jgi:drug/metabolite transporter (DMT)-like permease